MSLAKPCYRCGESVMWCAISTLPGKPLMALSVKKGLKTCGEVANYAELHGPHRCPDGAIPTPLSDEV